MEEKKGIFTGSKEYLEKSFLEELSYKIWSTKGARFQADKRLTVISKMSNISFSILSAYLIIAGLIAVYNLNKQLWQFKFDKLFNYCSFNYSISFSSIRE